MLGGLEAAWLADDSVEVNELLPHVVGRLRTLVDWGAAGQQVADAVQSVSGVLRTADAIAPTAVSAQMQSWSRSLTDAIAQAPDGVPDVTSALSSINDQVSQLLPKVQRVSDAMASVADRIGEVVTTLGTLEVEIGNLRPQVAFATLSDLDALETIDFARVDGLLDAAEAFVNNGVNLLATMGPHRTRIDASCAAPSECPLQIVRDEIGHLQEVDPP